ncbi:MAG TPA: TIGR03557 family F420-dependent LLM class oxidoreductase [Acidimicrobiia bacterium]|jgi:G6PDH family F420-dependent oxidoreductase
MTSFGYTLSSEETAPRDLVAHARRAEETGFDFVSISDHFHPWLEAQGHSPFVWGVLGAIAASTDHIAVGTGVTCPIVRLHPGIVAHAAATASLLLEGRFFLGVGTGEALNEHIFGARWPRPEVRREMLEEAVEVIRALFTGETVDHRGRYYEVENARLFDPPAGPLPIIVSGFGTAAAELAGRIGDGLWANSADKEIVKSFERAGGAGPRYAQLDLCWAADAASARRTVREVWANAAVPGQLSQDLPTWTHFEQATQNVTEELATESVPCGPDIAGTLVDSVRAYVDAGFDHLYFHQIGPDQAGFFAYWERELRSALQSEVRTAA